MTSGAIDTTVESEFRREIQELQRSALLFFLPLVPVGAWLWGYYTVFESRTTTVNAIPVVALVISTYFVYALREKRYAIASRLLVFTMMCTHTLLVSAGIDAILLTYGILIIIVANTLLTSGEALGIALVTWGVGVFVQLQYMTPFTLAPFQVYTLILYLLTWGTGWAASYPLNRLVESTLHGWAWARDALDETRQRRAEIYRALRSLEEATYRIERLNNELILAQRDAEEARASKAKFVAIVSHELRGPLNLILGFSRMIALHPEKYSEALPASYRADLDAIYRNSRHLAALVDDVLDLSQIEASRLPLVKDRLDIQRDVIEKVVETVLPLAERKGLTLSQEISPGLPWILADAVRLRQALLNLLTNAARFTERGEITVRAASENGYLRLSVQDTGPGISAEDMSKLFKEFSQLQRSETREGAGSGLGLSISKQLVELHGGKLWAESQRGIGTTFHLALPLPGAKESDMPVITENHLRAMPHDICLIAHPDPRSVNTLARLLGEYHCVGAPGAEQALALIDEFHPKAVITIPELADKIHAGLASSPYDVPVISCVIPQLSEGHLEGVLEYVTKPVNPEVLTAIIQRIRQEQELTILVVDDDPDAVRLMEMMLTSSGCVGRVLHAYEGRHALGIMEDIVPDIVFVDLVMPEMGGEQLVVRMRQDQRLEQVPVVIVSAKDMLDEGFTLGFPISVQCKWPLQASQGAQCLLSLLGTLNPQYVASPSLIS